MNTNEGIKRGNSQTKLYQTLFISLNYRLQTELNVHPLINFFLLRDNQFTSVGLHSTIVLKTQVHSNTPCWGLKNLKKKLKKKRENYHNAEIKAQSRSSSFFSSTLWKNLNIYSSRPNFKWTPYVEANWANVAICFPYLKTYPYLANTCITRKWSQPLRPLVTQNFFFSRTFKRFNYRWSFLIHESCIFLKSYSVEKNGSFRYFLPKLLNCFHVYSSHFKQTIRNQSFNDYRSFEDFSLPPDIR